jgi:type IV pilus assembly protein PilY1
VGSTITSGTLSSGGLTWDKVSLPSASTFMQGSSSASLLQNPLWYAAKYGGFTESTPATGTPNPNVTAEWDAINNTTGAAGADGVPDNYFDVKNPANLITAMSTIFDSASQPDASAASVATNSTNLKIESRVYQAKFSSADWSGQLLSFKINTSGVLSTTAEWDAGSIINGQNYSSGRVIITKGNTGDGVAFSYGNLTGPTGTAGTQKNLLDKVTVGATTTVDGCGPERVAYLRGDGSHEGASGTFTCASTNTVANFRERNVSKLGDIVNSNPWYVGKPVAGYSDVDQPGYSAFRTSLLSRTPVVYVAGNDGMLHGFDASVDTSTVPDGVPTATSGKEVLAYIPTGVYSNLSALTHTTYNKSHRYFVDGSPMIGDADLDSSATNNWRSVLVGAMGAGGKGYYALDVSNPANFSEANASSILLWEFTASDDADVGYAFNHPPAHASSGQPKQLVKMANGKWAVVLGNGYNSTSGKAALYILFIEEGVDGTWSSGDYVKILVDSTGNNGLSTPVPFDMDGDGIVDVVYAGDLKGNMWKFLVGSATPSNWSVAFSTTGCGATTCTPLFTALNGGTPQAITWPPEVTKHPSQPGTMVLFGTGKYLEGTDNSSTDVQAYYGIWDINNGTTTVAVADLVQRHISLDSVTDVNGNPVAVRISCDAALSTVSTCATSQVPWATKKGWFVNLPSTGERATGIPKLLNGVLYINTFIPSTAPCDAGGTGWLMGLDYINGETPQFAVFDTNNDGVIDSSDSLVVGLQVGAALGGTTLIQGSNTSTLGVGVSSLTSGVMRTNLINFGAGSRGRVNWRELVR